MRRFLAIALLLTACRTGGITSTDSGVLVPAAPAQWLVWTQTEAGPVTLHLEDDGAGGARTLGSAPGVWLVAGDHVWEFSAAPVTAQQVDCDCLESPEASNCERPVEFGASVLRSHSGGDPIALPPTESITPETQSVSTRLDGTVGPFAFVTTCVEHFVCGAAHPGWGCSQRIIDLRTRAEVDTAAMCAAPLSGGEARELLRDVYADESELDGLAADAVSLTKVAPRYDGEALPRFEEQYTGPTCYACSDGLWDAYTVSSTRTVDAVPKLVETWLKAVVPPPATVWSDPRVAVGGWSAVPNDPAVRRALTLVFSAPR